MWNALVARLRAVVARRTWDSELDEEMRYHLDREAERNVANGMSPRQARDAARRAFGNVTAAAEQARDAARWTLLEEIGQDVSYALRGFRRTPGFTVAVIATIG